MSGQSLSAGETLDPTEGGARGAEVQPERLGGKQLICKKVTYISLRLLPLAQRSFNVFMGGKIGLSSLAVVTIARAT